MLKRTSLDEHKTEDPTKREAAHDSRAPLAIGHDSLALRESHSDQSSDSPLPVFLCIGAVRAIIRICREASGGL
jgi:hypothetical protein